MKIKNISIELEKQDVVSILTDAFCTHYFGVSIPKESEELCTEPVPTLEDKLTEVLFKNGAILITDYNSFEKVEKWKPLCSRQESELFRENLNDEYGYIIYKLYLKDINEAVNTEEGYNLLKELLSGHGDMFTAYDILQFALFGKTIYG